MNNVTNVGVVGTGFIAQGLVKALLSEKDIAVTSILTRRKIDDFVSYPKKECLTNSVEELVEKSDIIVECSGDVIYGTDVVNQAFLASIPVITMNSELQVTTGSYFADKGYITEAEGDQPGCLAALHENIIQMGFKPLVYGNIKGFLNINPLREDMEFWRKKNNLSLPMVTSFTDGTKVQIEQVLVANGLGSDILQTGLLGPKADSVNEGGELLATLAKNYGSPISDYIICPSGPAGVFITAEHQDDQKEALRYFKVGEGPYYTLTQNYHLCHLEILKTIRRVINGGKVLLNNSQEPSLSVGAIAKRNIKPGEKITQGIGSFQVRGEALRISENKGHIPIGLLQDAIITKPIELGQFITFDDVEIPNSLALQAWIETEAKVLEKEPVTRA